jgi:hypothetical protein
MNFDEKHECCNGHVCCICGCALTSEEDVEIPNPFDSEIYDNYILHKLCKDCAHESYMET